jgi:CDP-diacylglycerol pyrophosphatase
MKICNNVRTETCHKKGPLDIILYEVRRDSSYPAQGLRGSKPSAMKKIVQDQCILGKRTMKKDMKT